MNQAAAMQVMTPNELEIVITREFNAPRSLVFDAWTNPKHVPKWLLGPEGWTMTVCEIDLRVGGASRMAWRNKDGSELEIRGTYREIKPPEQLVATESWGGPWPETLNTLVFTDHNGKTTVTLTILYPSKEARDKALQSGMKDGMAASFYRFEKYLATLV
jgi:uncharacterized protein YndB with AHSA1/START domain